MALIARCFKKLHAKFQRRKIVVGSGRKIQLSNIFTDVLAFHLLRDSHGRACFEIPARFKTGQNLNNHFADKRRLTQKTNYWRGPGLRRTFFQLKPTVFQETIFKKRFIFVAQSSLIFQWELNSQDCV